MHLMLHTEKCPEITQRKMKNNWKRVPQHIILKNILLKALNKSKDDYMHSNEFISRINKSRSESRHLSEKCRELKEKSSHRWSVMNIFQTSIKFLTEILKINVQNIDKKRDVNLEFYTHLNCQWRNDKIDMIR